MLAGHLGRSVRECQVSVDAAEFVEWQAYYNLTHFGELRADRRNAELLAMLHNINRGKNHPPKSSDDYMPFRPRQRELTDDEVQAQIEGFFSSI